MCTNVQRATKKLHAHILQVQISAFDKKGQHYRYFGKKNRRHRKRNTHYVISKIPIKLIIKHAVHIKESSFYKYLHSTNKLNNGNKAIRVYSIRDVHTRPFIRCSKFKELIKTSIKKRKVINKQRRLCKKCFKMRSLRLRYICCCGKLCVKYQLVSKHLVVILKSKHTTMLDYFLFFSSSALCLTA